MQQDRISSSYLHSLACCYHEIDQHGILVHAERLHTLKKEVLHARKHELDKLSQIWNSHVYVGKDNSDTTGSGYADSINLNASSGANSLLEKLKRLGYNIPKQRRKDKETGDVEYKESADELALRRAFAEEQDLVKVEALKAVLQVREYTTLLTRYINARLFNNIFYSNYNIAGTVTGRRSCRKNTFGLGGNSQNFPKHYAIGERFLECLIPRPGNIYFIVDQMQAEDWPVSALALNHTALKQLESGFDRHTDLASFIFSIPKSSRSEAEWKKSIERYLGKKTRHANNYGMRGQQMSDSLAKEGFPLSKFQCDDFLKKVNEYDPQIEAIFHHTIKQKLYLDKKLTTPFGRERYFLGLRSGDSNYKILNEGYSYIPQSTVGDNTGFAVYGLHRNGAYIVNESHDSITQEVTDKWEALLHIFNETRKSFDRSIKFDNGIEIRIPIEAELGLSFGQTFKLKNYTETDLRSAYDKLKEAQAIGEKGATEIGKLVVSVP